MGNTLIYLLEKEIKQFVRDPFLPKLALFFPVMVILILPLVADLDFKNISICIVDNDNSTFSRRLIASVQNTSYFRVHDFPSNYKAALNDIEQNEADLILEIPADYEKSLTRQHPQKLSITANAVNAQKGNAGINYLMQIIQKTIKENGSQVSSMNSAYPEMITIRNFYNETLNFRFFMIPALMAMLIILLCGFLPALNIVKEKENGTIEQINVTPINKLTFTFAKLIPYWLMGLLVLTIAMLIAYWVYGLAPVGNIGIIYGIALLFILTMSSIGLIVSNYSSTMQQTAFVMFFFIITSILMSGLFTPIESMPGWAQTITNFIPPRYFIEVMRGVYLKGCTFPDVSIQFLKLGIFAIILMAWAALSYKKQL